MRAAFYNGFKDYSIEEIEDPIAGDEGVVVKVRAAGVCGGDLHAYKDMHMERPPGRLVYGHENAGEVVEVGKNVKGVAVGDRVFSESFGFCFTCDACKQKKYAQCTSGLRVAGLSELNGGFAEYLWVPVVFQNPETGTPSNILKLPDSMSFQEGALTEPINIGSGVVRDMKPDGNTTVLVFGAGMIGLGTVMNLKSVGVSKIISCDISDMRLKAAGELGADVLLNGETEDVLARVMAETGGVGVDVVVEAAGVPETFHKAIACVRRGGRITVVAYFEEPVDFRPHHLINKGVKLLPGGGADFYGAFELVRSGAVKEKQVISHVFPLDKVNKAHETAIDTKGSVKVMIDPWC
ncbi:MAG: alcohol dehydrogenase catalytic domain-containing protein [Desulfobacterales bacterium]